MNKKVLIVAIVGILASIGVVGVFNYDLLSIFNTGQQV